MQSSRIQILSKRKFCTHLDCVRVVYEDSFLIINNYSPQGWCLAVDIYLGADSCFSIYKNKVHPVAMSGIRIKQSNFLVMLTLPS